MKKLLLVANVAKEHVLKFHVPTIKRLAEEGWQVDLACGGKEVVPYCDNQYELPIDRSPFKTHFVEAIHQLCHIIEIGAYDIVYCHTSVGATVARIAARSFRKQGLQVVKFAHGTYFYKGAPIHNYLLFYPLYKYLGSITDDIITITHEDYEFTKRHFSSARAHYVHGIGIDTSKFHVEDREAVRHQYREQLGIPQDATVLIYVAEISKNKNQRLLLQTMSLVLDSHPNTYMLLVGPEHDDGKNRSLSIQMGISDHIRFLGWRNDVNRLLAASDICTASSIREGLGLNLIEAMAAGLPIIATKNSGHAEILQRDSDVGYLVPFDKHIFASKVIELIDNVSLREEIGGRGVERCITYDNKSVVPQIVEILNDCLMKK